ncbi:hypothetical protein OROGR_009848 [Orobanche gracilis]
MGFFSSMVEDGISSPSHDIEIDDTLIQGLYNNGTLNFAIGSLDEKSLPAVLWWTVCHNVDIWCSHAAKKDLKIFLTLLIQVSLYCMNDHDGHFRMHLKKVTVHQIRLEFLSNTVSFEQRFVCRYMASRFCKILQKPVSSIFVVSRVDLSESPDWTEVIYAFENFTDVQIEYFSVKSSSLYVTFISNLESAILHYPGILCQPDRLTLGGIGKCISLQGKVAKLACRAELAHHDRSVFSRGTSRLGQLRGKIEDAIERALVVVQEGLTTNYKIVCGISDEAKVAAMVESNHPVSCHLQTLFAGNWGKRPIQLAVVEYRFG